MAKLCTGLVNGLPRLLSNPIGQLFRALDAYRQAGEAFPKSIDNLGLEDLVEAQKSWLSAERDAPVIRLLESLKK